jgi:hypothetical protein
LSHQAFELRQRSKDTHQNEYIFLLCKYL